jgi:hypothetical protein
MNNTPAPQDDKPELKEHLSKSGIKMQEKRTRRKSDSRINQVGGTVNVNNNSNPNSGSSYNGIFGG